MRPIKNVISQIILLIFSVFFLVYGCGYTTHSVMPEGDPTLYVANFVNKINVTEEASDKNVYYAYKPGMEIDITREIIDRFIFDGNYKITSQETAHFLLKGQLVRFERQPLRYDANENITEYRINVVVDIELHDLEKETIVWTENNFAGESTYRTSGRFAKSEVTAVKEAIKDLARRVVERTVENW